MVEVVCRLTPCERQALTTCRPRKLPGSSFSVLKLLHTNFIVYGIHPTQDTSSELVRIQAK